MRLSPAAVVVALLLCGGAAQASSNYPAEVQRHLSLSYTPQCSLCHANGVTGPGTVTTPFGMAMKARGLVCCDIASLDTALDALVAENNPLIEALKGGTAPSYGCFNITGQGPNLGGALAFLLTLLVLLSVRRGARRSAQ